MVSRRTILRDHVADARAAVVLLEVAGDALLQVARLADVEHARRARRSSGRRRAGRAARPAGLWRRRKKLRFACMGRCGSDVVFDVITLAPLPCLPPSGLVAGTSSAASSTTTATSACAGAWPATWRAGTTRVRLWIERRSGALRRDRAPAVQLARRRRAALAGRFRRSSPATWSSRPSAANCPPASSPPWPRADPAGLDQPRVPERRRLGRTQPRLPSPHRRRCALVK